MASPSAVVGQAEELLGEIRTLDSKFRKSCDQILLLNNQIEDLQVRYDRALWSNRRSYRYSIRLRLATLEGVRNMFYEYAHHCANKLEELQNYVFITGREPFASVGEWEPVSSEDESEMSMSSSISSVVAAARSPSLFSTSELGVGNPITARLPFTPSSSSEPNHQRSNSATLMTGNSSASGLSNSDLTASASRNSTSSTRSPNTSASSSVLNLSPGYGSRQRSDGFYRIGSASHSSYSTGRTMDQDSFLESHLSSSNSPRDSTSSNSPTSVVDSPSEVANSSAITHADSAYGSNHASISIRPSIEELSDMDYDSDEENSYGHFSEDL